MHKIDGHPAASATCLCSVELFLELSLRMLHSVAPYALLVPCRRCPVSPTVASVAFQRESHRIAMPTAMVPVLLVALLLAGGANAQQNAPHAAVRTEPVPIDICDRESFKSFWRPCCYGQGRRHQHAACAQWPISVHIQSLHHSV
jgi:hypothetical protein